MPKCETSKTCMNNAFAFLLAAVYGCVSQEKTIGFEASAPALPGSHPLQGSRHSGSARTRPRAHVARRHLQGGKLPQNHGLPHSEDVRAPGLFHPELKGPLPHLKP